MSGCRRGSLGAALFEPHDDDVEDWRKKKTKTRYSKHSEEDSGAEGLAHFSTGAAAEYEWQDAEYEGKGSHKDWTQSQAAGFDRGGEAVLLISVLDLFGELDDEDGVFAGEADEHNKADLGKDVVLH